MAAKLVAIDSSDHVLVTPGNHFTLLLPDGTMLDVEQTADDFSITARGFVCFTKATSETAKRSDAHLPIISGRG